MNIFLEDYYWSETCVRSTNVSNANIMVKTHWNVVPVDLREFVLLESSFFSYWYCLHSCSLVCFFLSSGCCSGVAVLVKHGLALTVTRFSTNWRSKLPLLVNSVHQHSTPTLSFSRSNLTFQTILILPKPLHHCHTPTKGFDTTNLTHDLTLCFCGWHMLVECSYSLST
jgi:hypothetical protein